MEIQTSVIVFSKGRPLQLHAYMESLLKYSDITQKMITVLCCEMSGIRYDKVRQTFPQVTWVTEQKFENDLRETVAEAAGYVMFGCDDVVFTRHFCVKRAVEYLQKHDDVFGFSMRLGTNVQPQPKNLSAEDGIFEWDWNCKEQHYNYPWELDCTLYRKSDIEKLLQEEETPIKNPNFFEAMVLPEQRQQRIARPHMACNKQSGCAVVITVNRVQETHQNGYDDSMLTDIYSLDRQYNDEGNTLDLDRISKMENHVIHVGAEYFLLRKQAKGYSQKRLLKKKWQNIENQLLKYPRKVYRKLEREYYKRGGYADKLHIMSTEETLHCIEKEQPSFLRYGDGEIAMLNGDSIPFQEYNEILAKRLSMLLQIKEDGLRIGIPYYYMKHVSGMTEFVDSFAMGLYRQRKFLLKHCRKDIDYIDTAITQIYQTYQDFDFESYYSRMQHLLQGRDVTVICGEGILDKLQYHALDACKSVEYIYAPSMNAYAEYDSILQKALQIDKNRLVMVILGPTAKVLVYDLFKAGYTAWDIGHYLKDYDSYRRGKPRTQAEITQFYKPD